MPADKYVPGQYQWSVPVKITTALLDCRPPTHGTLSVILEIGGVLKSFRFTVAAGTTPLILPQSINQLIPANTVVRWRASFTGAPEDAAVALSITMQVVSQSVSQVTAARPKLTVQWVNGLLEKLTLYTYDADTHAFTEFAPGISAGRASIVRTGDTALSIFIGATEVLRVAGSMLQASALLALGGVVSVTSPRLVFLVDATPIATLGTDGFRMVDLTENTPPALGSADDGFYSRYEFYSDGLLTAVVTPQGVTAETVGELP